MWAHNAIDLVLLCRPYDGKWSKTMMGYGSEDNHFVVELTYNYGIKQYVKGNEFQVLTLIFISHTVWLKQ